MIDLGLLTVSHFPVAWVSRDKGEWNGMLNRWVKLVTVKTPPGLRLLSFLLRLCEEEGHLSWPPFIQTSITDFIDHIDANRSGFTCVL